MCKAEGHPKPTVKWKKEDGQSFFVESKSGGKRKVSLWSGEHLRLSKVRRHDMGAFLCIASNGVPPTVSRRVSLRVNCKLFFLNLLFFLFGTQ